MQISIVILLFSDQISRRGESFQGGGKLPQGGALWKKASLLVSNKFSKILHCLNVLP